MLGFDFGIKDIVDILLVALILYEGYRLLRRSGAVNLFWGILAFLLAWFLVSMVFQLELVGAFFDRIISVGAIALIVIFQEEIRAFFYRLGARFSNWHILQRRDSQIEQAVDQIVIAVEHMAKSKTGALIVLAGEGELREYADTGEIIDAIISAPMIENIFFKNTPLHDGALIVSNNRLAAAACIMPVSKQQNIPKNYGLRHRAALGISEKNSDCVAIVVSEETGHISVAHDGHIKNVNREELLNILTETFALDTPEPMKWKENFNFKNLKNKIHV